MEARLSFSELNAIKDQLKNNVTPQESRVTLRQRIRENMQDYKMLHTPYSKELILFDEIVGSKFSFFRNYLIRCINDDIEDLREIVEGKDE